VRLCRVANTVFSAPPLSWLFRPPRLWDRRDPLRSFEENLRGGLGCLEGLLMISDVAGKAVLDVGCGMGDRTVVLALAGAAGATGLDLDPEKLLWARSLQRSLGSGSAQFVLGSASALPFPDRSFHLVLLLDVIEHVQDPLAALQETQRVLLPGGKALINFPPYRSPWGAHLFEHVPIPWAHLICPGRQLLELWREIHARKVARGEVLTSAARTRCIMEADSVADLWSLNEMTIKRFMELLSVASLEVVAVRLHTPGGLGTPLTRVHPIREYVVTRVSAVVRPQC